MLGKIEHLDVAIEAVDIFCGIKYSWVLTSSGDVMGTGSNKYNELGPITQPQKQVSSFSKLQLAFSSNQWKVLPGQKETYFVDMATDSLVVSSLGNQLFTMPKGLKITEIQRGWR